MQFSVDPWTINDFAALWPLLDHSAGYVVGRQDELEYFERESPDGWLWAKDADSNAIGFLRYFPQKPDWSHSEFLVLPSFPGRKQVAKTLLQVFSQIKGFPCGHRLRFEVLANDFEMNYALVETGFSDNIERFFHFSLPLAERVPPRAKFLSQFAYPASEVRKVLSHLHPVEEEDVARWIENGSVRAISDRQRIVAAAQVFSRGESAEINRIATSKSALRQGHATRLLELIATEQALAEKKELFLKVEDRRTPAIAFYRNFGFLEVTDKEQIWHSKRY